MKVKHSDGKIPTFECDFDGRTFIDKNALRAHIISHAERIKCNICQALIKITALYSHKTYFHGKDKKIQCEICLKTFKSIKRLQGHKLIHDKRIECDICGKKYQSPKSLRDHKKKFHDLRRFECEICGMKFKQKVHMKNHQKTHDKNRQKAFKCHQCDYSSDNKAHLAHHQNSHRLKDQKFKAMENPLKCSECPSFSKNKAALKHHMNSVHPKVSFQCDLCARFIKTKNMLLKHIKIHIKNLQKKLTK
jgi:KRAB domain-containing zinc finger protein